MTRRALPLVCAAAAIFGLAACGERPQTAQTRKPDTEAWKGTDTAFAAGGWKAGDKAAWEEQMRLRAQAQNEYTRAK